MNKLNSEELVSWRCPKCRRITIHSVIPKPNRYSLQCLTCHNFLKKSFKRNDIEALRKKAELNKKRNCFYSYLEKNVNLYSLSLSSKYSIDELISILNNPEYMTSKEIMRKVQRKLNRFNGSKIVELYGNLGLICSKPIIFLNKTLLEANKILYLLENESDSSIREKYRFCNQTIQIRTRILDSYIFFGDDIYSARSKIDELDKMLSDWKYRSK